MGDVLFVEFPQHNRPKPEPSPIKQVKAKPKPKAKRKGSKTAPPSLYHRIKCAFIDRLEAYML